MNFASMIELTGLGVVLLTHLVLIVAKFQKHENQISSLEDKVEELYKSHVQFSENSKTLHNIEGKIEIMISLYQKNIK